MENIQNRHDLTDAQREISEPVILKAVSTWDGGNAGDNRIFVNGSFWILRTGTPWWEMPPQ